MDDLDRILKMRRAAPFREGMEQRILQATQPPIMAFILLPRPILMMVLFMVLGFGLGLFGTDFSSEQVDYLDMLIEEDDFGDVI